MRRARRHSIGGSVPVFPSQSEAAQGDGSEGKEKAMVVAVRIRPLSSKEIGNGCKNTCSVIDGNVVTIRRDCRDGGFLKSQATQVNEYAFDAAFKPENSQQDVYEKTAKPFIPNLLKGLHVTVFAYGATGAGKTHTMLGNSRVDDATMHTADAGIIPQSVKDLFDRISAKKADMQRGESWTVSVTFVEIYNEQVYDLLQSTGKPLSLREDPDRGVVVVAGVDERATESASDVMELLAQGNKNRKTEATMANAVSSRSHAVLQLCVKHVTRSPDTGREAIVESKLSLIDLAGSERASATNNRGARLHEGANINKSLLALANCINALASNSNSGNRRMNVKYRDSRLTHLLKSSLEGGNCNLVMIANINPSHLTFEDSHNTLKYANRAKNIKVNPIATAASVESNWMQREENLREENRALRARIAELESLVNTLRTTSSSSSVVERGSSSKARNQGIKVSQDDMSFGAKPATVEPLEVDQAPPVPAKAGSGSHRSSQGANSSSSSSSSDRRSGVANPFLEAIMPSMPRKRDANEEPQAALASLGAPDGRDMDVEPKDDEIREVSAPEAVPMPAIGSKRSRNSLGNAATPGALPPAEPPRSYKTRRSSLGARVDSGKSTDGGIITFNKGVAGPGFTIAEDAAPLAAARPAQQKPTSVSSRRKSLAAVSALLNSIVDENAQENSQPVQPPASKRAMPDLSRAFGGGQGQIRDSRAGVAPPPQVKNRVVVRRGVSNGHKEVSAVSAESNDKLSEMEWIDI